MSFARRIFAILTLALCAASAHAQFMGLWTTGLKYDPANIRPTGQIFAPDGSAVAPSYSFANQPGMGIFRAGLNTIGISASAGAAPVKWDSSILYLQADSAQVSMGSANDLLLARDAANTLAQRNGVNAQAFRLYNTFTDASNYARLNISTAGVQAQIMNTAAGSGILQALQVGITGNIWQWSSSSVTPNADNSIDVGGTTLRFRNLYIGSAIFLNAPVTSTGTTYTVAATDNYLIANAAATQTLTLPAPASNTGRTIRVKNIAAFTVVSASANVVPLAGGAAGTAILAATAGKWADLTSDGTNWVIMAGN